MRLYSVYLVDVYRQSQFLAQTLLFLTIIYYYSQCGETESLVYCGHY
jgi:hypothetical protein